MPPLIDFSAKSSSNKEIDLVQMLGGEQQATQLQVVKALYTKVNSTNQAAFRKLKSRVQKKLLNHLYFLDHTDPRHLISRRYELQCLELFHQANILFRESEFELAERLARKCLRLALDGEFTQYTVMSLGFLRDLYAQLRRPTQYRTISAQLVHYQNVAVVEEQAKNVYLGVRMEQAQTVRSRRVLLNELSEHITKMEALHRKINTYNTFEYVYRLQLMREELSGNFEEIIKITGTTEALFEEGKVNKKRFDTRFNKFISVWAHLRGRQVEHGLRLAEEYIKDFHPSSANWFYFLEHYMLLALHAKEYSKAYEILRLARKNPYYGKQRAAAIQRWDLFEVYLHFIQPEGTALRLQFSQFIQTVPDYSRDKQGYNVAILVLQFLYYLRQRNLDALLTRLEGLRKYEQNHLRDPATLRSQLFFRLLLLTVREDFAPQACEKKGQSLLNRLREAPQPGDAYAESEIIPYEDLWALTLNILRVNAEAQAAEEAEHER
ncbi:hypothetical protein [Hymenobacter qilianensis]|uniref:Uncharacterized protein n=1 Tax=Hymenobacter qilianensis TaxID=1385715 RepID=A0A7H0GR13_9BACT|nr:hypothetical protein [Hymenobacter qilianensis]QNP50729.1 hypothetical protein H9L05_11020 [Hymenobacter qilianensis]